jgi:DNA polymerase III subunit beta
MKFKLQREALLKPLQLVSGVVERRQTLPVLSNILVVGDANGLQFTGTDLEVELVARLGVAVEEHGETTLPARKFLDICRTLPEQASLEVTVDGERAVVRSGRSRFTLSTLPAADFPAVDAVAPLRELAIEQGVLRELIERTHFAMAQQDVRYYLNGLMLEMAQGVLRAVATDGHRLALCEVAADITAPEVQQVIVPRKGVLELLRLLGDSDAQAQVQISSNHMRVSMPDLSFTSKLVDGRFPDYSRVIPTQGEKVVRAEREALRQALTRASILSNEKYRGVRFQLLEGSLRVLAHNPEQEEAEEELEVDYRGGELEIGFNVTYLLDALAAITAGEVVLSLSDANSSCLIRGAEGAGCKYVVMPMRL